VHVLLTALAAVPLAGPPPSPPVPPPAPADTLRVPAGGTVPAGYVAIAVRV